MDEIDIAFQEALDYLYSFIDYSLTRSLRYTPEKFNLERMRNLLDSLGNPHRGYAIFHVAGTKGKGSTAAMIASALRMSRYKTGFYTSPHLQDYTERIQVNGQQIPKVDFVALISEMKPLVAKIERLTTFEITTALAFLYFSRQKVDAAVVEVGLGGRLDATNVVDPLVSVITSLSMDHVNVLGNTLAEIAGEKAGIIKPGRPVVLSPQKDEARVVVEQIAQERKSPLVQVGRDYLFTSLDHSLDNQTLQVWKSDAHDQADNHRPGETERLTIPLLGYHQVVNAATAYAALQTGRNQGLDISDEAIRAGFASVSWRCRFEIIHRDPLVILDSAHNRDSALKLRLAIDDYLPGTPVILVFGASEDKDIQGMFAELLPRMRQVIVTQSVHPRAADLDVLVDIARQFGCPAITVSPLESALKKALELANGEAAVVVAGSLFVAAAARSAWQEMTGERLRAI